MIQYQLKLTGSKLKEPATWSQTCSCLWTRIEPEQTFSKPQGTKTEQEQKISVFFHSSLKPMYHT